MRILRALAKRPSEPVTVWRFDHASVPGGPELLDLLSSAERRRADRLRISEARRQFVVARALLRLVLAKHLNADPAGIVITQQCRHCGSADHGKPAVAGGGIEFSVSHAGGHGAIALHPHAAVGVDLEVPRPRAQSMLDIALSATELAAHRRLPAHERDAAALRWWTRKEAVLKATGWGLAVPPDQIRVSAPDESAALMEWPRAYALDRRVWLSDLECHADVTGCVAVLSDKPVPVQWRNGTGLIKRALPLDA